jgi:excisionase family DNA binding protein
MSQIRPKKLNSAPGGNRDIMTLSEAATFLRLPPKTVERLVAEQGLPARKIGKEWRFLRAAIERWLEPKPAYAGPSNAQIGALTDDPTFDAMMEQILSYRKTNDAKRS